MAKWIQENVSWLSVLAIAGVAKLDWKSGIMIITISIESDTIVFSMC
jgi:hypothetical protein